jgi:hypothetical protein
VSVSKPENPITRQISEATRDHPGSSLTCLSAGFSALEITRWALVLEAPETLRVCFPEFGAAGRLSRGKCCTHARTLVLTPVRPLISVLPPYATSHRASSLGPRRPSRSMFSTELPIRHARPLCTGPSLVLHSRRHLARGRCVHATARNILDTTLGAMSVARWAKFARCLTFDPATNASYGAIVPLGRCDRRVDICNGNLQPTCLPSET